MARRRNEEEEESGGWVTTYADMVTLLMAFFVMLYAISQVDQNKFEAFIRGLEVPFANTAASQDALDGQPSLITDAGRDVPGPPQSLQLYPEKKRTEPPASQSPSASPSSDEDAREEREELSLEEIRRLLNEELAARDLATDSATVRSDDRGVVVSVSTDKVLFAIGSTEISETGDEIVAAVAAVVNRFDGQVIIEGHTDDIPIRGPKTNWDLSAGRSLAVLTKMYEEYDVPQRRLQLSAYGQYQPRVKNNSPDNRQKNRRVDIVLVKGA